MNDKYFEDMNLNDFQRHTLSNRIDHAMNTAIAAAVAAEREACAKIAEDKAAHYKAIEWYPAYGLDAFVVEDERIAAAIRARNGGKGE